MNSLHFLQSLPIFHFHFSNGGDANTSGFLIAIIDITVQILIKRVLLF